MKRLLVLDDVSDLVHLSLMMFERYEDIEAQGILTPDQIDWDDPPDVVLLDLMMPGVETEDLAAEMRQRWPEVKIIVWTAAMSPSAVQAGNWADILLSKPIDPDVLVEAVRYGS